MWVIRTQEHLDSENSNHYWQSIDATDQRILPISSSAASSHVGVQDVNDNTPETSETVYYSSVPQNSPKDVSIIQIQTFDPDSKTSLTYQINRGNLHGFITIKSQTGLVSTTSRKPDHEKQGEHTLEVTVSDRGSPLMSTVVLVVVKVQNKNDNARQFLEKVYKVKLVEKPKMIKWEVIYHIIVHDEDKRPYSEILYSIDKGDKYRKIFAKPKTGLVSSKEVLPAGGYHILTIKPLDSGQPQKSSICQLHIEWIPKHELPKEALVFEETLLQFSAMENDSVSLMVGVMRTQPPDTLVWFNITDGNDSQYNVENGSGNIIIAKALNAEQQSNYNVTVEATDGTRSISMPSLHGGKVPENVPPGILILQVSASEADIQSNGEIEYRLTGSGAELFRLDSTTGALKTLLPLDREKRDMYSLTVQAVDGGNRFCQTDVIITIEDINDNVPTFTSDVYHITVFENTKPGTYLARLQASDADTGLNSKISYLFEDSAGDLFSIEEHSGIISLSRPLNKQIKTTYRLRVRASDYGFPLRLSSLCYVEVDVLDTNVHPPLFKQKSYISMVSEDTAVGTRLLSVFAASRNMQANIQIRYSLSSGNTQGLFSIDSHTGEIFSTAQLDYEVAHEHYLTVKATVEGMEVLSDTTTVAIHLTDINDNSPVFSQEVYTAVVSEDAEPGSPVLTVMSRDADEPSNNIIHFSLVDGNRGSAFNIEAHSGVVKVARHLDREKVVWYNLTILASDNGNPPKSSIAAINLTVDDVNDNPPVFSQGDYSLIIKESLPAGATVYQFSVTDSDAAQNGPPFTYKILKGNKGNLFSIDQQGVVRTKASLKTIAKDQYVLRVQVSDSGKPPLHSSTYLNIHLAQESVYPPSLLSQEVFILVSGEEYSRGIVGKIHATDLDENDTLTYSLQPPVNNLFSVSSSNGFLMARRDLGVGRYEVNVSVSDGHFTASASVTMHVKQITQHMMDNSVSVHFAAITAEDFIQEHWRNFQKAVHIVTGSNVQILSLQLAQANDSLDVLMCLNNFGSSGSSKEVLQKLNTSTTALQEQSGLRVVRVMTRWCSDDESPGHLCRQVVTVDPSSMTMYSTNRVSYIVPRHHITSRCLCKGGSLMTFGENSYIKYRLRRSTKEEFKFSLRLKTLYSNGVVMFFKGRGYGILEVVGGRLQCQFDCGNRMATMSMPSVEMNDSQWHTIALSLKGNHVRLVVDHLHSVSGISLGPLPCLGLEYQLILGGHVGMFGSKPRRSLPLSLSLYSCMDAVQFNGHILSLHSDNLSGVEVEDVVEVTPGCGNNSGANCASNPCLNGGRCSQKPTGGYYCRCNNLFTGVYCEFSVSPCASNPCLYGGTCIPNNSDYSCRCRGQYTGQSCEIGSYCKENPCRNGGRCINSQDGPVCECEPGYKGERCLDDVNECLQLPCLNGGWCVNTYGSFNCSCSPGFSRRLCEMEVEIHHVLISTFWNNCKTELAEILIFMVFFILAVLLLLFRTGSCKPSKEEQEIEKYKAVDAYIQRCYLDYQLSKDSFVDIPPQVPVRPICFTPNIPRDSCKDLERASMPEFRSFTPDMAFGHRKTEVMSNSPQHRASCSPTDSDTIRKLDWDEEHDENTKDTNSYLLTEEEETSGEIGSAQSLANSFPFIDDNSYHWDTSDWMPNLQVPGLNSLLHYEFVQNPSMYCTPCTIDMDYLAGSDDTDSVLRTNNIRIRPQPSLYEERLSHLECTDKSGWPQVHTGIPQTPGPCSTTCSARDHSLEHPAPQTGQQVHQGSAQGRPLELRSGNIYSGNARQDSQDTRPCLLHISAELLSNLSATGEAGSKIVSDCFDQSESKDITTQSTH